MKNKHPIFTPQLSDTQFGGIGYWVLGTGYWVLGIRYWCLSVISVNFIYLRIVKNRDRKKSSDANTQPGQAGIEY
jgi:hypothetical protein